MTKLKNTDEKTVKMTASEAFEMNARKLSELIDSQNAVLSELKHYRLMFVLIQAFISIVAIVAIIKL